MFNFEDVKTEGKRIYEAAKESVKEISQPIVDWAKENKNWLIAIGIAGITQGIAGFHKGCKHGFEFSQEYDNARIDTILSICTRDYEDKEDKQALAEICNAIDQIGPVDVLNIINGEE